jgi:hypothetical protein
MYQQEVSQKLNSKLAANIVNNQPLIQGQQVNHEAMNLLFEQLMVINPSIEIYLLDLQGKVLAYSAPQGKVKRMAIARPHRAR